MAETVFEERLEEILNLTRRAYEFSAGAYTYEAMNKATALLNDYQVQRAELETIADEMAFRENFVPASDDADDMPEIR